jgi:flavin reductase (DIM6/NTAB) family NADH-FMN oxidoreductase RutF
MTNGRMLWKVGDEIPKQLRGVSKSNWLQSIVLPRPVGWLTVDDEHVALLDGYTAACYTPPVIFFAESSLPKSFIVKLRESGKCTISTATLHDPSFAIDHVTASIGNSNHLDTPISYTFQELQLIPAPKRDHYPCAVATSPIHMYFTLSDRVTFDVPTNDDSMLILIAETVVVNESVLSDPTDTMKSRAITAKIDASLIQPIVSIGNNQFRSLKEIRSMPRPQLQQNNNSSEKVWTSSDFQTIIPAGTRHEDHKTMEWNYRVDGHTCSLGFNPTLAFIMPRPIGWISTYSKINRISHLAPYSFFIDIAHGATPMVAFSAYRPMDGSSKKDAHKDTEEMGCFCYNLCTKELAVAVNLSAAEMKREESEFELAGLIAEQATTVDAPYIRDVPVHLECIYVKTIDIGSFSIVVGRVQAVSVESHLLNDKGQIDLSKINLLARLGYTDEFGLIS